mgnify:CR=1 FL=1
MIFFILGQTLWSGFKNLWSRYCVGVSKSGYVSRSRGTPDVSFQKPIDMGGAASTKKLQYHIPNTQEDNSITSTELMLRERIKEMNCLYSLINLINEVPNKTGDATKTLQSAVSLLPPAWLYPYVTSATLTIYHDISIASKTFREVLAASPFKSTTGLSCPSSTQPDTLSATIKCENVTIGTIEMHIHVPKPKANGGQGSYLPEEITLLNNVASKIGDYLTRAMSNDQLLERQKELACLHRITSFQIEAGDHGIRKFLKSVVHEIKHSFQFPNICDVQIKLLSYGKSNEIKVQTETFAQKKWTLQIQLSGTNDHNPIVAIDYDEDGNESVQLGSRSSSLTSPPLESNQNSFMVMGSVIVSYRRPTTMNENTINVNKPFLDEEYVLLKSICAQLSLMIHSRGSDTLLSSMLPREIARSLRETGCVAAKHHTVSLLIIKNLSPRFSFFLNFFSSFFSHIFLNKCTILFTDIVGFTSLSANSAPTAIFDMLNNLYTKFDALVSGTNQRSNLQKQGDRLYKVETIGDAYMVVSGLPDIVPGDEHAVEIVRLAIELMKAVATVNITTLKGEIKPIHIRCGIHSGDVVAGVVGSVNPRYCLFGDAVNTASRMESNSEEMKMHISKTTFQLLEKERIRGNIFNQDWELVPRGGVEVKGKGTMQTWWVEQIK